ncbi:MAG: enoyl-CoA hydratase [Chloroflexi bacterium]|nr:MAG: enoyl-CoA hydratase [Chloroflexota bacterium]MBL1193582.1 enoyl-CoA hydratase [Chloroflexota bacterium]NOH10873.1 enoyl-CoA hydratase [Chloroflexota bacterium]
MTEELVLIEKENAVGTVHLNRPDKLNALSPAMLSALADALEQLDVDKDIRVIIIAGSSNVFAAGADIEAMAKASPLEMKALGTRDYWLRMRRIDKPLIAAVSGYAFGGGCELALQCDLIVASETAQFAQPEIKLGIIPGAGGTQRLTKAIGPYRAMEMVLTGEAISAQEAYQHNLINRVVPVERYLDEAKELARLIAERPPVAVRMAREAVRRGVEYTLTDGMEVERRNFLLLFDTDDQAEGMNAFLEKRPPEFKGE